MNGAQQKICYKMLHNDYTAYYAPSVYNLDIIFYKQGQLVYLVKAYHCEPVYSCWNSGLVVVMQNSISLQLQRNYYCDNYYQFYDYSNVTLVLEIYNENYELQQKYQKYVQPINSSNINIFNYSCQEINCSQINSSSIIDFYLYDSFYWEKIELTKIYFYNKHSIKQVSVISGSILIFILLVLEYFQFKKSKLVIQEYQGHQTVKKLSKQQCLMQQLVNMVQNQ
ncbi:Hypothetical_protein [Hexamita inflata]|uniref:Hypothetical_protein n=1 Tax=Hexamita inflata TaxID=28002 RepID=A0AA86UI95_9EUKA|nr:Hypothetical protein HINF_LOCUS44504 [Hexamita inflata]